MDRIVIAGIDVYAHHGVHPAERELGQRFVVDVELFGDWSDGRRAAISSDALDYVGCTVGSARSRPETRFQLLEALAARPSARPAGEFARVERVVTRCRNPTRRSRTSWAGWR